MPTLDTLKQLLLPRVLPNGCVELGCNLMHKMLRNCSFVEKCLSKFSSCKEFQAWLLAVEDWVSTHTHLELDDFGSRSMRTVACATTGTALLQDLERRGALEEGCTS